MMLVSPKATAPRLRKKSDKEQVRGCLEGALVGKFGIKQAFNRIMLVMNYNSLN